MCLSNIKIDNFLNFWFKNVYSVALPENAMTGAMNGLKILNINKKFIL